MAAHFQDRHHPTTLPTSFQITQEERTQEQVSKSQAPSHC